MPTYPVKSTLRSVPVRIEVRDRDGKVQRVIIPEAWRKLSTMMGRQMEAGGAVEVEHRRVEIQRRGKRIYVSSVAVPGHFITETVDVSFIP